MATNGMNSSEDVEMEHDGEKVVTMMDVLQEQQEFEEDANAVLGASDDKNCTFSKGYVKRQAIYACLTCCPEAVSDPMKRAGVCLACSLTCHENHELVELYTKRNFRCDCGNPKFTQPCHFTPKKTELNYENKYNQNFSGLYCNCKRPYPDPEATEEEEMIQCIVCEDWLHINHLEATVPNNDQYAEMICKACMEDIDFLQDYNELVVNIEDKEVIVMDPDLDVTSIIKAKEISKKEEISNENDKSKENDALLENIDSIVNEIKNENNADVDKSIEHDKGGDSTDTSKDADSEKKLPNDATVSNESNKDIETDKTEKISDENAIESKPDKNTEVEKMPSDITSEGDKPDKENEENKESTLTSADKAEEITGIETEKMETKEEIDSKDENVTTTTDDSVLGKDDNIASENDDAVSPKDDIVTTTTTDDGVGPGAEKGLEKETKEDGSNANADGEMENTTDKTEHKRKLSNHDDGLSPKKQKLDLNPCVRPRGVKRVYKGATFWPSNFRQKLCTCTECLSMYKDLAVLFLTDPEDTVTAYEALGKENIDSSQYEKGLQALSSLDRIQQINALTEYNKMRDRLLDFLKSFKDRKEIVKEEDIKAFFAGMKPKREPDGVYFCR